MKKIVLTLIFFGLLIIPLIINGNLYYLGGDDMRLYYVHPEKYLENYVFNTIAGNTLAGANTGFATVAYYAPMFYFIKFLKLIPVNTQNLMYGLNMSLGFLSFYAFLGHYVKRNWLSKVCSSLFYVLSPFLLFTLYRNQMLSMYLISVLPASLYFFISGVRTNKIIYILLSILIFSVFSTVINTLPWWSGFLITAGGILLYEFIKHPKPFIKSSILASVFFVIINIYWLPDFVKTQVSSGNLNMESEYYNSEVFQNDNLRVINGVSAMFSPLNIIFNTTKDVRIDNKSPSLYINLLYILVVITALYLVGKSRKKRTLYVVFFISFLISWYFFSPNLGDLGRRAFTFAARKLPAFGMYRNMFDKFALSLAFFYAATLGISLSFIENKSRFAAKIISILLILITLSNSKSLLLNKISAQEPRGRMTGEFNEDFLNLAQYIKNTPDKSKVLWLPLNYPTYTNIEDKNLPGHYYSGLSPFRIFADRSDYAGGFSFITGSDFFVGDRVWLYMKNKDYESLGKLFMSRNTKYIVVDKQKLPEEMMPFMYGGKDLPILTYQDSEFMDHFLGEKIQSFGRRYDLYTINADYMSDLIYLTESAHGDYQGNANLEYTKINNYTYEVVISGIRDINYLAFLESYNDGWMLSSSDDRKLPIGDHKPVFDFANIWEIRGEELAALENAENGIKLMITFNK